VDGATIAIPEVSTNEVSNVPKNSENPLKKSLVFSIEEGHIFGDGLELDLLPMELWDLILSFCDDATTAKIIPRICKVLYNVTSADSIFWKAKSKAKNVGTEKPATQTWKRFYFSDNIKLFPLLGFEIGNATYAELLKAEGATANASGDSRYVTLQKHNFWVEHGEPGRFTFMYIVRNIYPIPETWEAQGVTWKKSFNEYKAFFKRWPGNYVVTETPHNKEFMGKECFTARVSSIAQDNGMLYQLDMQFGYAEGKEDSEGTLYSISITSANAYNGGTSSSYRPRYEKRIIRDAPEKGEYYI
jgi:hypothetical protein